ncbi:MAG: 3-phosphoglycerate dehydrogenase family protein [Balneolales bacterium]
MKILIADALPEPHLKKLHDLGLDVMYEPKLTEADLVNAAKDAAILIVRSSKVNAECIKSSPDLSLIVRAGAGVNNIDMKTASDLGIYVSNCPGKNSIAVAELAVGLMLAIDRRIPDNVIDFRNGKWNKALYSKADGIFGKKLGVIGVGQIGEEVIKRAQSFGMDVIAWSRSLTPQRAAELDVTYADSIEKMVRQCDIVSVHLASTPETKGIITRSILSDMKPGTIFINTARAEVVDEDALIEALEEGNIRAGIDVFDNEPEQKSGDLSSRLQKVNNLYVTHHIGASTEQAQNAVAEEAVSVIRDYIQTGKARNWVNRCEATAVEWQLVVRHYDKPGVIANVMSELKSANINAEEFENVIFDGKVAASCTIQLSASPDEDTLKKIQSRTDEVISATLIKL